VIAALAFVFASGCQRPAVAPATATAPSIHWDAVANTVEIQNLPPSVGARLRKDESLGSQIFAVRCDTDDSPPMLGRYAAANHISGVQKLVFFPRFPFVPGQNYRATFDSTRFPEAPQLRIESKFTPPKSAVGAPAGVVSVYPTSDRLPENLLRFYVHFATPMRRGEAYQHIRLLTEKGTAIASPFLEMAEELWDADGQRLTLFIDPGRIKRGLKPREDLGPVLEKGQTYRLIINGNWSDANGQSLGKEHKKAFRANTPVEQGIEPGDWKIEAPAAGTKHPVTVRFSRPLDHALLLRTMAVLGGDGQTIAGEINVADGEMRWIFAPHTAWIAGKCELVIDRVLEDICGNRIGRPFEVDEDSRPLNAEGPPVRLAFEIR
jgi:hypothetical protein